MAVSKRWRNTHQMKKAGEQMLAGFQNVAAFLSN
jgi:hypothetical protein